MYRKRKKMCMLYSVLCKSKHGFKKNEMKSSKEKHYSVQYTLINTEKSIFASDTGHVFYSQSAVTIILTVRLIVDHFNCFAGYRLKADPLSHKGKQFTHLHADIT